ncbi:MAG: hypothetical protein K0S71_1106 [Clostridia bacterium]|nr:hypothetical protein [Clostridia bacterium]
MQVDQIEDEIKQKLQTKMELEGQFKNGVSWFYWIAGLSIINTVTYLMGMDWSFIAGLGVTQMIDVFTESLYGSIRVIALFINFLLAGFFAFLGYLTRKRRNWVIILGVVLYSLDTIIFIFFQDWISVAFHGLAIYSFIKAILANNKLKMLT